MSAPGPSLFLLAASLFFLTGVILGVVDISSMVLPYAIILAAYLAVRVGAFVIARTGMRGNCRALPGVSPLRWLAIGETPDAWTVGEYRIGKGLGNTEYLMKYRSTDAHETGPFNALPEVRRLRFHSYHVTVEKEGALLVFSDPLRTSGRIFYPPHYTSVRVPLPEPSSLSGHSRSSPGSSPE